MKIGYLIPEFPGQTHAFFMREFEELKLSGIEPEFISTRRPRNGMAKHSWAEKAASQTVYLSELAATAMTVFSTVKSALCGKWNRFNQLLADEPISLKTKLMAFAAGQSLATVSRNKHWQHLHVHSAANASLVALACHTICGIPYSITLHGDINTYGPGQKAKWMNSTFGIAINDNLTQQLVQTVGPDLRPNIQIAPMGVNVDDFQRSVPYESFSSNTSIPLQLFACGRMSPGKGHDDLVRAAHELQLRGHKIQLRIAGGPDPSRMAYPIELQKLIDELRLSEQVTLLGSISEDEVRKSLESAHIFLSGSRDEALGVATMEAMSMAVPVVVTRHPGVAEMVRDQQDGLLVDSDSPMQIADAVERLIESPDLANTFSKAGRLRIEDRYHHRISAHTIRKQLVDSCQPGVRNSNSTNRTKGRKRNVLLIAEACNPEWTSVPLVGFNQVNALAKRDDLEITLATHVRNRAALEKNELSKKVRIEYIDNEWIASPMYRLGKLFRGGSSLSWTTNMAMAWPSYVAFEHQLFRRLRDRIQSGEFDLIHRITPLSPTMPSPIAKWSDTPMVIGPLNGGLPWPKEFSGRRSSEREWLVPVRSMYKKLPYYRQTYKQLQGVISGSQHTATEVPEYFQGHRFYLPENGIDLDKFQIADSWQPPKSKFRFIFAGRLVPYKGLDLVIEAMSLSFSRTGSPFELVVVGDGPERDKVEKQVFESGLNESVRFLGKIPQEQVAVELRNAQAFVFPSIREFGGGVVLEAMSSGLPCIVVDHGGPAELVDEKTGIKLPVKHKEQLVSDLADSMELLNQNHEVCRVFSRNATARVLENFTWESKAEMINNIYCSVLGIEQSKHQQDLDHEGQPSQTKKEIIHAI